MKLHVASQSSLSPFVASQSVTRSTSTTSKVLVTGVAGFVGSNLAQRLLSAGYQVLGLDDFNDYYDPAIKRANVETIQQHPNHDHFNLITGDLRDETLINNLMANQTPAAIAHLGGYGGVRYSNTRAKLYNDVNVRGSINLLDAAIENNIRQFVFASTSSVYGRTKRIPFTEDDTCNHPLAPYPASKKAVEVLGHAYCNVHQNTEEPGKSFNFTALRFFSVYGPAGRPDMMPFMVMDRIVKGEMITLYDAGKLVRDWTYVDDITAGIEAALFPAEPLGYQIMNLGRGEPVAMSDFVAKIEALVGKRAVLTCPPAPASEPHMTYANIDRARNLLGYDPQTSIDDGLAAMWAWYQNRYLTRQTRSAA